MRRQLRVAISLEISKKNNGEKSAKNELIFLLYLLYFTLFHFTLYQSILLYVTFFLTDECNLSNEDIQDLEQFDMIYQYVTQYLNDDHIVSIYPPPIHPKS